jgi:hypothetical protein
MAPFWTNADIGKTDMAVEKPYVFYIQTLLSKGLFLLTHIPK